MKKLIAALAIAIASTSASNIAMAAGDLHIFTFGDYLSPEAVKKFGDENQVKVTVDTYDSNDQMMAKIKAGGSGYDIAIGGNWVMPTIIKDGMAAKTEPNQMPNYKYVRPEFTKVSWDDGRRYTVPFLWGTTGFTVNKDFYKGPIDSWALIFNPPEELKNHINAIPEMEDVINSVSFYKGIPLCSDKKEDLKAILDTLIAAKKNWQSFEYGVIDIMVAKNAYATMNWNGSSMRARLQNQNITYVYPKEGMAAWFDSLFVLSDAPNMENAKLFQNFLMEPKNAALLTIFAHYDNGITDTAQYLPAEFKDAPEIVLPNGMKPNFVPACSRDVAQKHGQIWNQVMK